MKRLFHILFVVVLLSSSVMLTGCIFMMGGYSLSGASIPEAAKTFSVAYFPNNAPMVSPTLSTTLVEALKDKFSRQTRLQLVEEGGDFAFEGEIIRYTSTTQSVSGDDYAVLNRLTIEVKVNFTNVVDPDASFNQTFKAYADYDSTQLLTEIQTELDAEIVEQLVQDIYMAAASNW